MGFCQWDILGSHQVFIGLDNYIRQFRDPEMHQALFNTILYMVISVPGRVVLSLAAALLLNMAIRGRGIFRMLYFMPMVTSSAIIALIWTWLYSTEGGLLNSLLLRMGFDKIGWLTDPNWAMPSIAFMKIWQRVGYFMIMFLATLQTIPRPLYEAAQIDGANKWQRFWYITFPLLNPGIILITILSTIWAFQLFVEPFLMTGGGPLSSTLTLVMHLYNMAFIYFDMGYAASIGITLGVIVLAISLIERKLLGREIGY